MGPTKEEDVMAFRVLAAGRAGTLALAALAAGAPAHADDLHELVVTEPVHSVSYLPLYLAQTNGYFKDEKLSVRVLTTNGGAAHTNAVLSGQAFAFIGGPEHDAYAKAKGAELRAVIDVVDRGNVYFVARKGLTAGEDLAAFVNGKRIATFFFGGTPNSITRYMLEKWSLKAPQDVTLSETNNPGILAAVAAGQDDIGVISDPELTQGVRKGVWQEPFYNVPKELGPYAYSCLNVRLESIKTEPQVVAAFVHAVMRGLEFANTNPKEATKIAKQWFPTMPDEDLTATIDRTIADHLWSSNGLISEQSWNTAKAVVQAAGLLNTDVPYDAVIDMQFVKKELAAEKK
jgi:NitT/TauT family transport system substrate-binding protein